MKKGTLRLILPDGSQAFLGDPESDYEQRFHQGLVHIKNPVFFRKAVLYGDVGFSESYLDGDWDTDDIEKVISWFLLNVDSAPNLSGTKKKLFHLDFFNLANKFLNVLRRNTLKGSRRNIVEHYDLGNGFYSIFLDKTMTYSCAYFENLDQKLEDAQYAKVDLLCKKLQLQKGEHLLEIGSGWGFLAIHAAKEYGVRVTSVTLSDEQLKFARARAEKEGVSDRVEFKLLDYRKIEGQFDKIVSVEMLEAVGDKYYESFFAKCQEVLKPQGLMALQVITCPDNRFAALKKGVDFIQKHIFPGSLLPSIARLNEAVNKTGDMFLFGLEDMGLHYAKTLNLWQDAFDANVQDVRAQGFNEKFIRKWRYYLSYCAGAFRMKNISVVQMVYTRPNNLAIKG
ncbi:SAM-dependent methyltransferase [Leptospira sp. GIMC2001]|uniref:SAM-dependent methyltransferase n=1 Tax=Leptospira sp. GIMC2001 TaxID=1513297 RepID=UPI00234A867F|nr:cyclopropane-fatty-acyl-phospholipid synthase family protein [Leptospira sp. GIMC2001]WCL47832.1 cyclopropane-fatty-acyl-phospholipid synthase [Leptospira sp. GIMC2001]